MCRYFVPLMAVVVSLVFCGSDDAQAQSAQQLRRDRLQLESTLGVQDAKIGEQRVSRQVEVARLDRLIDEIDSRMTRLERRMLSFSQLPAVSVAEAEAELEFARVQQKESERRHENGESSEVEVARARLGLVRAESQLDTVQSANAEREILLELDVAFAKRQLFRASNEKEQLERLVAKGYASSSGLRYQILDVELAEKQLQLAQTRLQSQRKSSGHVGSASDR